MKPDSCIFAPPLAQAGVTLIELMIAMTLSLVILAGLATILMGNSRARAAIDKANQQLENGRYAMDVLSNDLGHAGYLGQFDFVSASFPAPATEPDPCATDLATLTSSLPLYIQVRDNGPALSCTPDFKAGTDIVVVRRASSCVAGVGDCPAPAGAPYFQPSLCNNNNELGSSTSNWYRLAYNTANLDRTDRACVTKAPTYQYLTRIYFIANNHVASDGIPTLMRAELGASGFTVNAIAEGIENLQMEYGIDSSGDGTADTYSASPNTLGGCLPAACVANLTNIVSIKLNLLARNTTTTTAFQDNKVYTLGLDAAGNPNTVGPFSDAYKRHVFQMQVKLMNPAKRREQ